MQPGWEKRPLEEGGFLCPYGNRALQFIITTAPQKRDRANQLTVDGLLTGYVPKAFKVIIFPCEFSRQPLFSQPSYPHRNKEPSRVESELALPQNEHKQLSLEKPIHSKLLPDVVVKYT